MMQPLQNKTVTSIFSFNVPESHYNLLLLFKFEEGYYLFFDSARFFFLENGDKIDTLFQWTKVPYPPLSDGITVVNLREDECTSYFIKFSNGDIFYIYQSMDGMEFWSQGFEIVSKSAPANYTAVIEHMNEDFVEDLTLCLTHNMR
jgi:hypothetical protein